MKHRLVVTTTNTYLFDPERVKLLHERLLSDEPGADAYDPNAFGDDPVVAVFSYLEGSIYANDVFEDQLDQDTGLEVKDYDPEE